MGVRLSKAIEEDWGLEELAMEYDHVIDFTTGKSIQYGTVNNKDLRRRVRELNEKGREVMGPFIDWQMEVHGTNKRTADTRAMIVWRRLAEDPEDPAKVLFIPDKYAHVQRLMIRKALTLFTTWMMETADRQEDLNFARAVINRIAMAPANRRLRDKPRKPILKREYPVFTDAEFNRLLEIIEDLAINTYGSRVPWYRAAMRLFVLSGQAPSSEFIYASREDVREAVAKHERGEVAGLSTWGKRARALIIPVAMVYEELKYFADWPFPWGIIDDVIQALGSNREAVIGRSHATFRKRIANIALIMQKEGIDTTRIMPRIRYTRIRQIWEDTHDFVLVQSMFGINFRAIKALPFLHIPFGEWEE